MKISFFEEFPTKENLEKIKLIDFPTKIYAATKSIEEFKKIKNSIKNSKHVKEVIYWPILKKEEGYWLSPWTKRKALERIIREIEKNKISVLWDAEYPSINKKLFLTESINFFKNKKLIRKFFKNYKERIYTAEYLFEKGLIKNFLNFCGLSFNPKIYNNTVIKMIYTSMHHYSPNFVKDKIDYGVKVWGDKFAIGLGVIAHGITGKEQLLTPKNLERDLNMAKSVNEVIIFRLGGLNKKYLEVIKKFV